MHNTWFNLDWINVLPHGLKETIDLLIFNILIRRKDPFYRATRNIFSTKGFQNWLGLQSRHVHVGFKSFGISTWKSWGLFRGKILYIVLFSYIHKIKIFISHNKAHYTVVKQGVLLQHKLCTWSVSLFSQKFSFMFYCKINGWASLFTAKTIWLSPLT